MHIIQRQTAAAPGYARRTASMNKAGTDERYRRIIENIDKLPSLPAVAARLIEIVNSPESSADDAAVYRIDDKTAIVQTVDFFTPVVDDPFQFGAVAAANSLSDIYAMGARPLFALNIVGFPSNRLPMTVLEDILNGARAITGKAGISMKHT